MIENYPGVQYEFDASKGWVEWYGYSEECPIDRKTMVQYKTKLHDGVQQAMNLWWEHWAFNPVIAYRIIPENEL